MNFVLIPLAVLLALFLLSLTPYGSALRKRMMARMYDKVQQRYEPHIAERKRQLLAELSGTVLEIGPGTGANFAYLPDGVRRWIGIEPNPYMHEQLREAATECGVEAEFRSVATESMDVEDTSVDAVLSTLVLCSVPDPESVVRDIHRVLKPGGRFVFVEHVAAPRRSRLRRLQRLAKPVWWYFADGCRPDRELGEVIRAGGFAELRIDEFTMPKEAAPAVVSPHVSGFAVK